MIDIGNELNYNNDTATWAENKKEYKKYENLSNEHSEP